MSLRGHNERSYRLDMLADEARKGLERVEQGEENTIGGWLAYGHALNEGRALFPADRQFGEWVQSAKLAEWSGKPVHDHDRAAAMWAAANADQFEEARQRGNPRTIRGIHAKWKEIEAEREAERFAEEQRKLAEERKADSNNEIPSERTNREDDATGREGYASDGSSRLSAGRTADPSDTGETVAEGDDPAAGESPALAPDPHRKGLAGLTRDALEDECAGLRADLEDARAEVDALKAERDDLKARIRDLSEGNQGRAISRLHAQIVTLKGARDDGLAKAAKETRRANFFEVELKKARKSLEGQEVEI